MCGGEKPVCKLSVEAIHWLEWLIGSLSPSSSPSPSSLVTVQSVSGLVVWPVRQMVRIPAELWVPLYFVCSGRGWIKLLSLSFSLRSSLLQALKWGKSHWWKEREREETSSACEKDWQETHVIYTREKERGKEKGEREPQAHCEWAKKLPLLLAIHPSPQCVIYWTGN